MRHSLLSQFIWLVLFLYPLYLRQSALLVKSAQNRLLHYVRSVIQSCKPSFPSCKPPSNYRVTDQDYTLSVLTIPRHEHALTLSLYPHRTRTTRSPSLTLIRTMGWPLADHTLIRTMACPSSERLDCQPQVTASLS